MGDGMSEDGEVKTELDRRCEWLRGGGSVAVVTKRRGEGGD